MTTVAMNPPAPPRPSRGPGCPATKWGPAGGRLGLRPGHAHGQRRRGGCELAQGLAQAADAAWAANPTAPRSIPPTKAAASNKRANFEFTPPASSVNPPGWAADSADTHQPYRPPCRDRGHHSRREASRCCCWGRPDSAAGSAADDRDRASAQLLTAGVVIGGAGGVVLSPGMCGAFVDGQQPAASSERYHSTREAAAAAAARRARGARRPVAACGWPWPKRCPAARAPDANSSASRSVTARRAQRQGQTGYHPCRCHHRPAWRGLVPRALRALRARGLRGLRGRGEAGWLGCSGSSCHPPRSSRRRVIAARAAPLPPPAATCGAVHAAALPHSTYVVTLR